MSTFDAIHQLLTTAGNYGKNTSRPNDVLAAAYRLGAAKLTEDGHPEQAEALERTARLMENM